jgi:hypothetical protein
MTAEEQLAWQKSLKPGDEVAVFGVFSGRKIPKLITRVVDVTKSGRIRVRREVGVATLVEFDSDGHVRGEKSNSRYHVGEWAFTLIVPVTDENRSAYNDDQAAKCIESRSKAMRQQLVSGISWKEADEITDDQLNTIEAILLGNREGAQKL